MLSVVLSAAMSHAGEFEAVSRFRALFEGASIGILVIGPDGCATEANPAIAEMLGRTRAELAMTSFRDYTCIPDDVEAAALALFDELMSGRTESYQAELRYCHSGGEVLVDPAHRSARARLRRPARLRRRDDRGHQPAQAGNRARADPPVRALPSAGAP